MGKYWGQKKSSFESVKGVSTFIIKIPFIALASKTSKRDDYIGVVVDKATIEINKAEKFLNVVDLEVQANLVLFEFWQDPLKGLQVITRSRDILLIRSGICIYWRRHRVHFLEVVLVLLTHGSCECPYCRSR